MHNEIIPDGVPIKLYIELEFVPAENTLEINEDALVASVVAETRKLLGMPLLESLKLDASNETKASRHLVFPVKFDDEASVRTFVEMLVAARVCPARATCAESTKACTTASGASVCTAAARWGSRGGSC